MAATQPTAKPWARYGKGSFGPGQGQLRWKLLIPGWGGHLDDDDLAYIVEHLEGDSDLRKWWGMKPSWKRVPEETVRRIALEGDEDDQSLNRRLARPRKQAPAAA
jgi:hypothetical protein